MTFDFAAKIFSSRVASVSISDPNPANNGGLNNTVVQTTQADLGVSMTARRRTRSISAPGVEDLAGRLSDMFDTKVKVQIGRAKGRIVVEFGSVDDLQRIIGVMAPEITGRSSES